MVKDEEFQGVERQHRKDELESRIGSTRAGSDWLHRVQQIGKPTPLDFDDVEKESNGEDPSSIE